MKIENAHLMQQRPVLKVCLTLTEEEANGLQGLVSYAHKGLDDVGLHPSVREARRQSFVVWGNTAKLLLKEFDSE